MKDKKEIPNLNGSPAPKSQKPAHSSNKIVV